MVRILAESSWMPAASSPRLEGDRAILVVEGDLIVSTASPFHSRLRTLARRRDVKRVVIDFSSAGRVDSAGVAAVSLGGRMLARMGKKLDLTELGVHHKAAFEMLPRTIEDALPVEQPTAAERVGDHVIGSWSGARVLATMIADTVLQGFLVLIRKKRLPAGSVGSQLIEMGFNAVFIVGLLSFLLGITMGFQAVTQLQRFGAGVFVADMISLSMVRELGPLITAIILTGRTGAAIAAELGTMKVRSEIDALATMGINPNRFLILPRLLSITITGPALTLMSMFIGMVGGMLVASLALDMPMSAYWHRVAERVSIGDFAHGLFKSVLFAWIIATAGSHLGMRANGDPSSVGQATTRTVVVSIFFIILVDALFATATTILERT